MIHLANVAVSYRTRAKNAASVSALRGVSLTVDAGAFVFLVGPTGAGKSTLLKLLYRDVAPTSGKIVVAGFDLVAMKPRDVPALRRKMGIVLQDYGLLPERTVWANVAFAGEVLEQNRNDLRKAVGDALNLVGMGNRADAYPHELSGGMRQRVMIAMALACRPALLLADEPTTALDVTVQAQILALINSLRAETGMAVLLITHDLGVVAETCDRVVVLYAGQVMETTDAHRLFAAPSHPYTRGLLASLPESAPEGATRLPYIKGQPPANASAITGCPFRPRCPEAVEGVCDKPLPTVTLAPGHVVRCHLRVGSGVGDA